jgi:transcriptional regulator with XRE-family HTH domain
MSNLKSFGIKLKSAREIKKFSQQELADLVNDVLKTSLKRNSISNYENGVSYPSIEVIRAIVDILDVSSDYLISGKRDSDHKSSKSDPITLFQLDELTTIRPLFDNAVRLKSVLVNLEEGVARNLSNDEVVDVGRNYLAFKKALNELESNKSSESITDFKEIYSTALFGLITTCKNLIDEIENRLRYGLSNNTILIKPDSSKKKSSATDKELDDLIKSLKK